MCWDCFSLSPSLPPSPPLILSPSLRCAAPLVLRCLQIHHSSHVTPPRYPLIPLSPHTTEKDAAFRAEQCLLLWPLSESSRPPRFPACGIHMIFLTSWTDSIPSCFLRSLCFLLWGLPELVPAALSWALEPFLLSSFVPILLASRLALSFTFCQGSWSPFLRPLLFVVLISSCR